MKDSITCVVKWESKSTLKEAPPPNPFVGPQGQGHYYAEKWNDL